MKDPVETAELAAFARCCETLSLTRAAAELGLPRPTLSRRLARLERRLEVRLLRRTTRRITLTDAGAAFYQHARTILDALRDAELSLQPSSSGLRGRLRVSVPPMMPASFHAMVSDFMSAHPGVRLEIHASSRFVDLQAERFDVALRAGSTFLPGLVGRVLARQRLLAVASTRYLERAGTPRTVDDLAKHRCLVGFDDAELAATHWPLRKGGTIRIDANMAANGIELLFGLVLRDQGIALLPEMLLRDAIQGGRVHPVLERTLGTDAQLTIVYLERELMPPATRAFVESMAAWAKDALPRARAIPEFLRDP